MSTICQKCLTGRGQAVGEKCATPGCDGIVEETPAWSTLVDTLPEPMTCGRRYDCYPGGLPVHHDNSEGADRWEKFKTNGQRVCSFCGSLHPDDFFALVKLASEQPADGDYRTNVSIEPSDKGYKVYVHQPGVRNAMEGGIKFYKQHLRGVTISPEQEVIYKKALAASNARFEKYLKTI